MPVKKYLNFDLQIEKSKEGFQARVINSPAGQASQEIRQLYNRSELENLLLRLNVPRQRTRQLWRRLKDSAAACLQRQSPAISSVVCATAWKLPASKGQVCVSASRFLIVILPQSHGNSFTIPLSIAFSASLLSCPSPATLSYLSHRPLHRHPRQCRGAQFAPALHAGHGRGL